LDTFKSETVPANLTQYSTQHGRPHDKLFLWHLPVAFHIMLSTFTGMEQSTSMQ